MEKPFLSHVEERWNALRLEARCATARSTLTRPDRGQLRIAIETREARASVIAREALRTLDITVHRFRDDRTLAEGPCASDADVDRRLQRLFTDLTASPFA
jgi:hypothetical protein